MSNFGARDFVLEIAKGNVPGHDIVTIVSKSTGITSARDIWDVPSDLIYPTGVESLELVTIGNDTAAGTGAQEVTITYLDTSWVEQTAVTATNAGTQAITTTNFYRLQKTRVSAVGTLGSNDNEITVRVSGGGAARGRILVNRNVSQASFYTVPENNVLITSGFYNDTAKGDDADIDVFATTADDGIFIPVFPVSSYQANSFVKLEGSQQFSARTDIKGVASGQSPSDVSFAIQFIKIDSTMVNLA